MIEVVDALPPADRRSAFANAPMGIGLTTPAGVLVDANPALCALVGRTGEELHGRSVLGLVHPEVRAVAEEAHALLSPTGPGRCGSRRGWSGPTAARCPCR